MSKINDVLEYFEKLNVMVGIDIVDGMSMEPTNDINELKSNVEQTNGNSYWILPLYDDIVIPFANLLVINGEVHIEWVSDTEQKIHNDIKRILK